MIALDGKTLRRSGDRAVGQKPLHLVSVWASSQRLVLTQEAAVTEAGGDDVLALKRNQPDLHDEVVRYFANPDKGALQTLETTEKDHGRIETRRCSVSHDTGWLDGTRRFPGEPRFRALKTLVKTTTRTDRRGKITEETRYFCKCRSKIPQTCRRKIPQSAAPAVGGIKTHPSCSLAADRDASAAVAA